MKEAPHEGILMTLRTAASSGGIFGLLITFVFALAYGPAYAALVGLNLGTWLALWSGGLAVLSHGTLRWMLRLEGQPEYWSTELFDMAVDRMLLRQIGGGYMFLHPTFQQYLAERSPEVLPLSGKDA